MKIPWLVLCTVWGTQKNSTVIWNLRNSSILREKRGRVWEGMGQQRKISTFFLVRQSHWWENLNKQSQCKNLGFTLTSKPPEGQCAIFYLTVILKKEPVPTPLCPLSPSPTPEEHKSPSANNTMVSHSMLSAVRSEGEAWAEVYDEPKVNGPNVFRVTCVHPQGQIQYSEVHVQFPWK